MLCLQKGARRAPRGFLRLNPIIFHIPFYQMMVDVHVVTLGTILGAGLATLGVSLLVAGAAVLVRRRFDTTPRASAEATDRLAASIEEAKEMARTEAAEQDRQAAIDLAREAAAEMVRLVEEEAARAAASDTRVAATAFGISACGILCVLLVKLFAAYAAGGAKLSFLVVFRLGAGAVRPEAALPFYTKTVGPCARWWAGGAFASLPRGQFSGRLAPQNARPRAGL